MEIAVDPQRAVVYEHGWQSWSPSRSYRLTERPARPLSERSRIMGARPDRRPPDHGFCGEGLLAVDPGTGADVTVVATTSLTEVPSIRASVRDDRVRVEADGDVSVSTHPGGVDAALAAWADGLTAAARLPSPRVAPTIWCSWYDYFTDVTEADIRDNVAAMDELELAVDVVQIDDGYEAEIGDWLAESGRFPSLTDTVGWIRAHGRRVGIWIAPFLVGSSSVTAREHPEWLVGDADAGSNWGQDLAALDVTHPGAAGYLREVLTRFVAMGIDFFKIDFIYAGALEGRRHQPAVGGIEAYLAGLELIREAIGPEPYLLGCGAPIFPSVGRVDAMRISADTAPHYEPADGDQTQPSMRAALASGRGRAWQHGRWWVNDADCLIARPAVEHREEWAEHVRRYGGLRGSSDRLRSLDDWGLATTRELLRRVPPTPFSLLD